MYDGVLGTKKNTRTVLTKNFKKSYESIMKIKCIVKSKASPPIKKMVESPSLWGIICPTTLN